MQSSALYTALRGKEATGEAGIEDMIRRSPIRVRSPMLHPHGITGDCEQHSQVLQRTSKPFCRSAQVGKLVALAVLSPVVQAFGLPASTLSPPSFHSSPPKFSATALKSANRLRPLFLEPCSRSSIRCAGITICRCNLRQVGAENVKL